MSHIEKLECRANKQRCWLTLITIVIVAAFAFAGGFLIGRCSARKCGSGQSNCSPMGMQCGPNQGGPRGPGAPQCAPPASDCCPLGAPGKPNMLNCLPGFPIGPGEPQFSGTIVIDRDGEVQTFKLGPDGKMGDDDDDGEDADDGAKK